ncbi:2Fe-2S iron-sulfur cluster-binding protein [Actinophytocola algeriensis]|uniref:Xanthine dehydrogenase YagT iron-sulfur-binding subunit n=1 Tax=Actinophytocola algeriensis TaxID=1768010 RepID=A0A7W7QBX6_9PSEU|nr:2Fe-2S iron-sulfur cluster-binding protein [Actinophytocola algeriensis]MBB4910802.1 xanthine dehydrogenase YagT iron-sulfur-binding subunit [Actinophytocola algeriensis]MBE1473795.1 xanthine dehydrogenase YagT iron-sulfur-binding subunit [Actinophytocola algeriensis]
MEATITITVDGRQRTVAVDTRTTLLDALRDRLAVTAPKKGCDHGQCGSCTVLLDGRRVLSCLALAVAHDGAEVVTAAGLDNDRLRETFLDNDAFQCGYCTPGQLCSAAGMLDELKAGWPSAVTDGEPTLSASEIRERMAGNLCRCGAYVGIVAAIQEAGR